MYYSELFWLVFKWVRIMIWFFYFLGVIKEIGLVFIRFCMRYKSIEVKLKVLIG